MMSQQPARTAGTLILETAGIFMGRHQKHPYKIKCGLGPFCPICAAGHMPMSLECFAPDIVLVFDQIKL